jgi:plastocyanin
MQIRRVLALAAVLGVSAGCASQGAVDTQPHAGTEVASMSNGVQSVVVRAGVDDRFHPSTIVVHPGKVRLVLLNTAKKGAGPPHDLQFAKLPGADLPTVEAGYSASVTFTAPEPGTYSFVCSIHAVQGMTGKLVVKP